MIKGGEIKGVGRSRRATVEKGKEGKAVEWKEKLEEKWTKMEGKGKGRVG